MTDNDQMRTYIGTKMIEATPQLRTSKLEGADDIYVEGYAVRYPDGYESWSPKQAFEDAYRSDGKFDFGAALYLLKRGYRMRRRGWNGQGMFVFLVAGSTFQVNRPPLNQHYREGTTIDYRPHLDMKAADGTIGVWLASQTDILAEDWEIA